jgi:beta-lactamase regulating signal transducer with metallopeptidase domain
MITYIIKSASCLALLLFFYHLILEKEKMHSFNRFYLMVGVIISLLIPFVTITIEAISETTIAVQATGQQPFIIEKISPQIIEESYNYTNYFIGFYLLISSILLIRFGRNLFKIIQKVRLNQKVKHQNATLILVDDKILPHTFWKAIFINKKDYENGEIEEELFTHELTHVTEKHTIDVLLIELLQIVFWINPLFIFLKKAIQLNHEFLADDKVINLHKNTFQYQHLLLNKAAWNNEYYLASNLNYSLTKKRLKMMTTQSSHTKIWMKKLAVIPLVAGFIFLFAERVEAQEEKEIMETVYEQPDNQKKLMDSEIYKKYYYKNLTTIRKDKNGLKVSKTYNELTKEEKARLIPPPPLKLKKKIPSKKLIEDLKDNAKYAIWIDGKAVKNEVLNNYLNSNFSNFFVSFVHKNARSKSYPQEYQAHLDTNKYFEFENKKRIKNYSDYLKKEYNVIEIIEENPKKKTLIDSPIPTQKSSKQSLAFTTYIKLKDVDNLFKRISNPLDVYKRINKSYESKRNQKPHFVDSSKERQEELKNIFSKLGSLFFKLSKEDKKKTKKPTHPHHPYLKLLKNNKVFYKLKSELTKEDELLLPPPPPNPNATEEQILKAKKAYEKWKKRTGNDFVPPPPITPLDHVIKMAKKDAVFYYEGNKISSDKAIELLKKNKKLNIDTRSKNLTKPIVKISKEPIVVKNN